MEAPRELSRRQKAIRVGIIKQKPDLPVLRGHLPDLRNLGALLRTLLLVNLLALGTVFIAEPEPLRQPEVLLAFAARLELPLFASVLLYIMTVKWVARLNGLLSTVVTVAGVFAIVAALFPLLALPGDVLWRWLLWALGATLAVFVYFEHRARGLTPALAEARLMALAARIRPHFLFNALNAVLGVIRSDPRRAERALEELAELFRALLRDQRDLVPLADELVLCRRYLEIETLRLGERLAVHWRLDDGVAEALIPPLMLQPLVENAIYHGIEPLVEVGVINVSITRHGPALLIEVDNPVSKNAARHPGNRIALDNIRERLELFFDLEAILTSKRHDDRHRVTLRLPFASRKGGT